MANQKNSTLKITVELKDRGGNNIKMQKEFIVSDISDKPKETVGKSTIETISKRVTDSLTPLMEAHYNFKLNKAVIEDDKTS